MEMQKLWREELGSSLQKSEGRGQCIGRLVQVRGGGRWGWQGRRSDERWVLERERRDLAMLCKGGRRVKAQGRGQKKAWKAALKLVSSKAHQYPPCP